MDRPTRIGIDLAKSVFQVHGGDPAHDALDAHEIGGAAVGASGPQDAGFPRPPAHASAVNTIRAHLSEFGIVVAKGIHNVDRLLEASTELPDAARPAVDLLADQLRETQEKIDAVTERIEAAQKSDPLALRLATIPVPRPRSPPSERATPAMTKQVDASSYTTSRDATGPKARDRHSRAGRSFACHISGFAGPAADPRSLREKACIA